MIRKLIPRESLAYLVLAKLYRLFGYILIFILGIVRSQKRSFANLKRKDFVDVISVHQETGLGRAAKSLAVVISKKYNCNPRFISSNDSNLLIHHKRSSRANLGIYVGNPDIILPLTTNHLRFSFFKKYNIGFWFWELEDIPKRWRFSSKLIDEVWVNSDFILEPMKKISSNIIKIPFYINLKNQKSFSRKELDLPKKKFLFIFTFDFLSSIHRKNPEAVIKAFCLAFPEQQEVYLLIKSVNGDARPKDKAKLIDASAGFRNIEIRDQFLPYEEQIGLIAESDCYISLHRSEGLGYGMAEAMYLGKPVIATNYSGNLEFMNDKNSCLVDFKKIPVNKNDYIYGGKNQYWAEPDIKHAAGHMRRIKQDHKFRKSISKQASYDIKNNFSREKYESFIYNRLNKVLDAN